jgi:carboxymethylenebutenolidase
MGGENTGGNGRQKAVMGGIAGVVIGLVLVAYRPLPPPPAPYRPDIHAEYVKYLSGRDTITAYLAYPERPTPAPGVIVIHEIFGVSDFVRQTTEQLAKDGFVAIAPDLLSRGGGTPAAGDSARKLIVALPPDQVTADLDGAQAYLKTLKAVRADAIGVIGFCWGGGQSFRYATNNARLRAFVVCYGPSPRPEDIARIRAKGLGVYAENDARINTGLPETAAAIKQAAKDYQYSIYPGVGHGFLRAREKPEVADSAWSAVIRFFRAQLETK